MSYDLTVPQSLFLLARDDETGRPLGSYNAYIQPGGGLAELVAREKIELRGGKKAIVHVIDPSPMGSDYIDGLLADIVASSRPRSMQHWVSKFSCKRDRIRMIGRELVAKGIVEEVPARILGIFPTTRWPVRHRRPKTQLKHDMAKILFNETSQVDEYTGTVIALANAGHLLKRNFERDALRANKAHIKRVTKGQWPAAQAATKAIEAAMAAVAASSAVIAATSSG